MLLPLLFTSDIIVLIVLFTAQTDYPHYYHCRDTQNYIFCSFSLLLFWCQSFIWGLISRFIFSSLPPANNETTLAYLRILLSTISTLSRRETKHFKNTFSRHSDPELWLRSLLLLSGFYHLKGTLHSGRILSILCFTLRLASFASNEYEIWVLKSCFWVSSVFSSTVESHLNQSTTNTHISMCGGGRGSAHSFALQKSWT